MKPILITAISLLLALRLSAQETPYGRNPQVGKFLETNNIKLYYEVYGEGAPLLLLHGNGGYAGAKPELIKKLVDKYQVILVDSRCHGQSGCSDVLNYQLMASDIDQLLQHLKPGPAYVYGHSDGGIIGLILAYKYPHHIKKLMVSVANIQRDSTALQPMIVSLMKNYSVIKDDMMRKHIKLMHDHPDISFEEMKKIESPVLIVSGDRDAVRLSHSIQLFNSIQNSQLCVLPGTTHFVAQERVDMIVYWIDEFFLKPFKKPDTLDWAKQAAEQLMPGMKY